MNKSQLNSNNLSDRHRDESKFLDSDELLKVISENTNDGIILADSEGKIYFWNHAAEEIFNYSQHQIVGKKIDDNLIPEQLIRKFRDASKRFKLTGEFSLEGKILECLGRRKDGTSVPLEISFSMVKVKNQWHSLAIVRNISEIRNLEQEISEIKKKFHLLTDQNLMGIGIYQNDLYVYVNQAYADIVEYSVPEILNWNVEEIRKTIHPDDLDLIIEQSKKKQSGEKEGTITYYSFRKITRNNKIKWVDHYSKPILYNGEPAVLLAQVDITERIEAEKELKKSEERYRLISENTDDLIAVYNEDGKVEYINAETHSRILGYNSEEFRDKSFRDKLVHDEDKMIAATYVNEGLEKGEFHYQFRLKHQLGNFIWFEVSGKTFIDDNGENKLLCVSSNINEKKLAEFKLKESEEKFRTIAEQSFMGIGIIQYDKIKYANKAVETILGYPLEEILTWSKSYNLASIIHPDDLDMLRRQRNLRKFDNFDLKPYSSYRIITKNGEIKWIDQYSKNIIYQGKEAELISSVDNTNRKLAAELIIEENKKLLELHKMRKDIIIRVSHELKTPLTSIYGASELLLKRQEDGVSNIDRNFVSILHRGALRLKKLVENLIDVSRLGSGKLILNSQKENLSEIIEECVEEMSYLVENRNLTLESKVLNDVYLNVDGLRIHQVVTNIISNSIKYTPKGGKITINLLKGDDYVDVQIKDTGIGINEDEMELLFEKFGKIEHYGKDLGVDIEGSGLGLFISKEIIELHGGQILVESKGRNKGTLFTIRLNKN